MCYLCNVIKKQRTMTRKERKEYILNLDKVVKRWKRNSALFCGGCCFSAGQIAKLLEAKGIRYQVICWQAGDPSVISLRQIVIDNSCCHVAIQVSLDGQQFIIGGNYHSIWATKIRTYSSMCSREIIECDLIGLECDNWNWRYNRKLNGRFTSILVKAVRK